MHSSEMKQLLPQSSKACAKLFYTSFRASLNLNIASQITINLMRINSNGIPNYPIAMMQKLNCRWKLGRYQILNPNIQSSNTEL